MVRGGVGERLTWRPTSGATSPAVYAAVAVDRTVVRRSHWCSTRNGVERMLAATGRGAPLPTRRWSYGRALSVSIAVHTGNALLFFEHLTSAVFPAAVAHARAAHQRGIQVVHRRATVNSDAVGGVGGGETLALTLPSFSPAARDPPKEWT